MDAITTHLPTDYFASLINFWSDDCVTEKIRSQSDDKKLIQVLAL